MSRLYRILVGTLLVAAQCACSRAQAQPSQTVLAHPGSFAEVEGSKLYYEECGSASQTVVLVHDGVVNSAVWDDVWPEFCKHFHTIRYDRRGYGRSPEATNVVLRNRRLGDAFVSFEGGPRRTRWQFASRRAFD